jgi:hypothetical protein
VFFQNVEFFETDKFQYLLIHKNGSSSVLQCMGKVFEDYTPTFDINLDKVRWTVIRDPYERFISGLKYDLALQNLELKDINKEDLYQSLVNIQKRDKGKINHAGSQVPYLINTHIDWYVDIKDLSLFLKMHFNQIKYENVGRKNIELNINKEEIMKHLKLDYYVYNTIKNSSCLWKWQNGNILC